MHAAGESVGARAFGVCVPQGGGQFLAGGLRGGSGLAESVGGAVDGVVFGVLGLVRRVVGRITGLCIDRWSAGRAAAGADGFVLHGGPGELA